MIDDRLKASPTIQFYKDIALRMACINRNDVPFNVLSNAIDYSIQKRFKDSQVEIDNNYKKKIVPMTLLDTCDYIENKKPIIAASGVLFQRHENSTNLLYKVIDDFIENRKVAKKTMFKYPKGSDEFVYWNLQQLLAKRDVNAIYGAMGQYSCILYNLHVAESTTTQGRSMISSSILFFEAFLSNNVKFGSLNEIITFIDHVMEERSERIYNDDVILDENITVAECFTKLMRTCGFNGYIPSRKDMEIVWDILIKIPQEDINRLFYKNNLYSFFDNRVLTESIKFILKELDAPFLNPNEVPNEIKAAMDEVYMMTKEYVYYSHQVIDKLGRAENMQRDVSIIIDTDSTIVSFDAWYRYVLRKTYDVPMKIKNTEYSIESFINGSDKMMKIGSKKDNMDINDYSEDKVQKDRLICPVAMIPQDNLRYSIINIIANICGRLIIEYMYKYACNSNTLGVPGSDRTCLLVQKNEFLFKRAAVCNGKKHYADIQEIQEGNMVPESASMAIMGLELMKSSLAKTTQEDLKKILYEDILNARTIDQVNVINKLKAVEDKIKTSIKNGERLYLKPSTMKSMSNYDDPMRIQPVKGAVVYNKIKYDYMPAINMDERNAVDILKVNIDKKNIGPLYEFNIDIYTALCELLNLPAFKDGIKAISLPPDVQIPEWLFDYIDFDTIVNDNLTPFPIETIGLSRMDKSAINYTNIIRL